MATRTFNYNAIADDYQQMNTINGEIADILTKIDKEVKDRVDVCDEAIYGDLGKQMLLDWDNTSANFDSFVNKFNNWSTLVTQAAGNYSQFESDISGFKQANPLGVTSGGITDAYTNTGYYSNTVSSDDIDALLAASQYYQLTGATYIDTGMVSYLKKSDIFEGIELALDAVTIVASSAKVVKYFKDVNSLFKGGEAAKNVRDLAKGVDSLSDAARNTTKLNLYGRNSAAYASNAASTALSKFGNVISNSKVLRRLNGTGLGSKILSLAGKGISSTTKAVSSASYFVTNLSANAYGGAMRDAFKVAKVGTPLINNLAKAGVVVNSANVALVSSAGKIFGTEVNVGSNTYSYFGETNNGLDIYVDASDNLVYKDSSGDFQYVTYNDSFGTVVTINTLNDEQYTSSMNVGGTSVASVADLTVYFEENYSEYFDDLSNNLTILDTEEVQSNG